jgi:hypothetical protein
MTANYELFQTGEERCVMFGYSHGEWQCCGGVILDMDPTHEIFGGVMEFIVLAESWLGMTDKPEGQDKESENLDDVLVKGSTDPRSLRLRDQKIGESSRPIYLKIQRDSSLAHLIPRLTW